MPDPVLLPAWNDGYPDRERLRHEVSCMTEAIVETLLDNIPGDEIRAIYLKGSAKKRWDTPIDYVPEASDLDLHIWFRDDGGERAHLGDLDRAIAIQQDIEARYRAKCPRPIHTPRPQLIALNGLMSKPTYMHSPPAAIEVLFGESCPAPDYSQVDELKRNKCQDLLDHVDILERFPHRVVDRPGKYLAELFRDLSYRVSPVGPIVLHLAGLDPMTVWSMNRTQIAQVLKDVGQRGLAAVYVEYYLARWRWFLSDFNDFDSLRASVRSALEVIERSASIATAHLSLLDSS